MEWKGNAFHSISFLNQKYLLTSKLYLSELQNLKSSAQRLRRILASCKQLLRRRRAACKEPFSFLQFKGELCFDIAAACTNVSLECARLANPLVTCLVKELQLLLCDVECNGLALAWLQLNLDIV